MIRDADRPSSCSLLTALVRVRTRHKTRISGSSKFKFSRESGPSATYGRSDFNRQHSSPELSLRRYPRPWAFGSQQNSSRCGGEKRSEGSVKNHSTSCDDRQSFQEGVRVGIPKCASSCVSTKCMSSTSPRLNYDTQ
jgi:hypothetical protein